MRAMLISDTHGQHGVLDMYLYDPTIIKDCDIIISAGDTANSKDPITNLNEQWEFINWYSALPFKHKIYVPGNHNTSEHMFTQTDYEKKDITRLINSSIKIDDFKIYGSPYSPSFGEGWAYNAKMDTIQNLWNMIPTDTDILITHTPPKGILDLTESRNNGLIMAGCKSLLNTIFNLNVKLHVFGHIHNEKDIYNHGVKIINDIIFVNASSVDITYKNINKPIIVEL